jgi:hypothetical protein
VVLDADGSGPDEQGRSGQGRSGQREVRHVDIDAERAYARALLSVLER